LLREGFVVVTRFGVSVATVLVVALAGVSNAGAEELVDCCNVLVGPVLGVAFGGEKEGHGLIGIEGGVGAGPERLNLGTQYRDGETFTYVELDPWFWVGGSLGVGYGTRTGGHGILGLWEGVPGRGYENCERDSRFAMTLSLGYRWTGVHEIYLAPKVGYTYERAICTH
jgi:hypothetical protein